MSEKFNPQELQHVLPPLLLFIGRSVGELTKFVIVGGVIGQSQWPLLRIMSAPENDLRNLKIWHTPIDDAEQLKWIGKGVKQRVLAKAFIKPYEAQLRLPTTNSVESPFYPSHLNGTPIEPLEKDSLDIFGGEVPQCLPPDREQLIADLNRSTLQR